MNKNALIIFARNPELGKVKNRLAKTIGKEKALEIYSKLLSIVYTETKLLECNKYLYLTERTDKGLFDDTYIQKIQSGNGLGEKMFNAIKNVFEEGNEKAIVVGTDVPGLKGEIINEAFQKLTEFDVVIGPAKDGGYYLIGMKECLNPLFENMKWSNDQVLINTLERISKLNRSYYLLEELTDIDTEDDVICIEY
ncbi:MAG TPA: TIGR04282 family arsenosugar biosynthesis glycosyltransferase [Ignavibacteria bacterium]|nr:TIGR04282 family arsenosugar biosynthesis glycosyltransferase [Ignavibacteria bacterium]HMR40701.1 TIGR04282 family arsenosugar biosynthesis glycosyltransferase [Ignavibacteria bacterium]